MTKKYYCNPLNVDYKYQFNLDQQTQSIKIAREAADPSMIMFKGRYYMFASMNLSVWVSDDLINWTTHRLPDNLPLYDYAPDVRVIGNYVYFSASKRGENCSFYRTEDVINGPYEQIETNFDFWDPNLFLDEDERLYFYWGCTNTEPLWGVELDKNTMLPIGEKVALIKGDPYSIGYERIGENHTIYPKSDEEVEQAYQYFLSSQNMQEKDLPESYRPLVKGMLSNKPYIEGAWMDKHNGVYYLQYAAPGTQYNGYGDGVYISNSPLGPFKLAANNPFSYKPSGFVPGAGHGSTMFDEYGNLWHASTARISLNHNFERRVGLWPAGFDEDGELFCNQNYGDFPRYIPKGKFDPWQDPEWMLLSYKKTVKASSTYNDNKVENVVDENIQTWWQAANTTGWIEIDLEKVCTVNAIQINFADDKIDIEVPGKIQGTTQARYIEDRKLQTRWVLEASSDGSTYHTVCDKSSAETDLPHDLIVVEEGFKARYLKLSVLEVPYNQKPCISGFRVFGKSEGALPAKPEFIVTRTSDLDMKVEITGDGVGYNILWGHREDKLYHSCLTFDKTQNIGALIKGQNYYVRVDAFNECGITKGEVLKSN